MKKLIILLAATAAVAATLAFSACGPMTDICIHEFTTVDAVAATCEAEGTKAHELCTKCNAKFISEEEVSADDLVVPALGHDLQAGEDAANFFDANKHFAKSVACVREGCTHTETYTAIQIGTAEQLMTFAEDVSVLCADLGSDTVEFTADIDMTGKVWKSMYLNRYVRDLTFDGKGHTISNLATVEHDTGANGYVSEVGFVGKIEFCENIEFKDITFKGADLSADLPDDPSDGVAVFVGYADGFESLKFTNCKIVDCNVEGGNWAGGFYGSASAYGPEEKIEITNCSVEGSTIKGNGTSGSAIGHATGSELLEVTLTGCAFKNNVVECTEDGRHNKAGYIIGSVGVGKVVITGYTVENVTAKSDGVVAERIYGRLSFGGTGSFTVDGVSVTLDYNNDGTAA